MPNERHNEALTVREFSELAGRPPTPAEESQLLWAMSRDEREQAMYRGALTLRQCCEWASRRPQEVPKLHGEFWFIAITTPEVADRD